MSVSFSSLRRVAVIFLAMAAVLLALDSRLAADAPLTSRAVENLVAFARLMGYVRYFHPTPAVATQDWNDIAISGARTVEQCADSAALAVALRQSFQAVAPSVLVWIDAEDAPHVPSPRLSPDSRFRSWRHFGFAGSNKSPYKRAFVYSNQSSAPVIAPLGGGVSCLVPTSVAIDPSAPDLPVPLVGQANLARYSLNERAVRLASVMLAWNVPQHFYPYFDVVKTDWNAVLPVALRRAATDKTPADFEQTLSVMFASLRDGHVSVGDRTRPLPFFPPVPWEWIEDQLVVTHNAPEAGLAPGDAVVRINGQAVTRALAAAEERISGATPQWIRYNAVRALGGGDKGTTVTLDVERFATRKVTQVQLVRSVPYVGISTLLKGTNKIERIEEGVWYLDLDRVMDADLDEMAVDLAQAKGLVFDLRGYPKVTPYRLFSHMSGHALQSPQWHVPVITRPDHSAMEFIQQGSWSIEPASPEWKAKKAFIVDGRAISFAESCLGIVEHYQLAEIVGTPTAGTNGNVTAFVLPGNITVSMTGMKVLKQDGTQHHGVGIHPTILVNRTRAAVANGRDEPLERAVEIVKRQP